MSSVERLHGLLSREGWAAVLVLAGAALLVAPPDQAGLQLLGWTVGVVAASFMVVLVTSRARSRLG